MSNYRSHYQTTTRRATRFVHALLFILALIAIGAIVLIDWSAL